MADFDVKWLYIYISTSARKHFSLYIYVRIILNICFDAVGDAQTTRRGQQHRRSKRGGHTGHWAKDGFKHLWMMMMRCCRKCNGLCTENTHTLNVNALQHLPLSTHPSAHNNPNRCLSTRHFAACSNSVDLFG